MTFFKAQILRVERCSLISAKSCDVSDQIQGVC